jgi:CheY-like chemotaxis protein
MMFQGQWETDPNASWMGRGGGSDRALEAQVQGDLRGSPYEAVRRVECRLRDGVLTLWGQVSSYYLKQLAQEVARRRLADAARIRNTLQVVTGARVGQADAQSHGVRDRFRPQKQEIQSRQKKREDFMSCKVLIADADPTWLDTCKRDLGANGFTVETAPDGLACLARLQDGPLPDALVLELDIPWGGGDGVLGWLREHEQKRGLGRCLIVVTGNGSPALLSERMGIPESLCLQKPILSEQLRKLLDRRPAWQPVAAAQGGES